MTSTFIVDCPICKAKVAAIQTGIAERTYFDEEGGFPGGERLHVGHCPKCTTLLAGQSDQVGFEGQNAEYDEWSDVTRVFPKPPKVFSNSAIPSVVTTSLLEADRSMQAGANIAACVMFGRALEGLCIDLLKENGGKKSTLGNGMKALRDQQIIDERLYQWGQQLRAFRNMAAHAVDVTISREDAEDLQSFVHAIVEYVYDLTERYKDFQARVAAREKKKPVAP
jgi:uncharacterized protein YutE (UPF0331/DUF86 family)